MSKDTIVVIDIDHPNNPVTSAVMWQGVCIVYGCENTHGDVFSECKLIKDIDENDSKLGDLARVWNGVKISKQASNGLKITKITAEDFKVYVNNKLVDKGSLGSADNKLFDAVHEKIAEFLLGFDRYMHIKNRKLHEKSLPTVAQILSKSKESTVISYLTAFFKYYGIANEHKEHTLKKISEVVTTDEALIRIAKDFVMDCNDAKMAYCFCKHINNNNEVRQIIIKNKDAEAAYLYCQNISDDADMKQVIIDTNDPRVAAWYCCHVNSDDRVRQVIIDQQDMLCAYNYCLKVADDADMRQVIIDTLSNRPTLLPSTHKFALNFCLNISTQDKQINGFAREYALDKKTSGKQTACYATLFGIDDEIVEKLIYGEETYFEDVMEVLCSRNCHANTECAMPLIRHAQEMAYKDYWAMGSTNLFNQLFNLDDRAFLQSNIDFVKHKNNADLALMLCESLKSDIPAMRQIIINAKDPKIAFNYCKQIAKGGDKQMRQVIVDAGDPKWAFEYCDCISNDADVRQAIVDAGDPKWAFEYCRSVSYDEDMRQVIVDAGNPRYAYWYCDCISNDADMRQVIVDAGDPKWALEYYRNKNRDADMRQVVVDAADPAIALRFCMHMHDDPKMRQIIINSGDPSLAFYYCSKYKENTEVPSIILNAGEPEWAYKYCRDVKNIPQMRQVILDAGDPQWAYWYCRNIKDNKDMRQVIVDAGDLNWLRNYSTAVSKDDSLKSLIKSIELEVN